MKKQTKSTWRFQFAIEPYGGAAITQQSFDFILNLLFAFENRVEDRTN